MKKMVVFNVGGALSSFLSIDGKSILIDLGKSEIFNPVTDFMIPLFERNFYEVDDCGRYKIEQLIISHPHKDHISAIVDFDKKFTPLYLTCPNDKEENSELDRLDFSYFDENAEEVRTLRNMYRERSLPLVTYFNDSEISAKQYLFYIKPGEVINNDNLISDGECYQNNVSLVSLFEINGCYVFFPGDIMKNGMEHLINNTPKLRRKLNCHDIDVLIASHHGLESSFCPYMFEMMNGNKTKRLNIISEKVNSNDNRNVDDRYYSGDYCSGKNNLDGMNEDGLCFGKKTSTGHICVDFSNSEPIFRVIKDNDELIDWFSE